MEELKICFTDHFGGCFDDTNIILYENTWNDFGYHGNFEFHLTENRRAYQYHLQVKKTWWLSICRIDGAMKKRLELSNIYGNRNVKALPSSVYLSFPSVELCVGLLLNYPLETRKKIAKSLCFNFGDDSIFGFFKKTEQYRVSILRGRTEEDFLNNLKLCKQIIFCDLPLSEILSDIEIVTNKPIEKE